MRELTLGGFNCRSYLIQPLKVLGDSCWEDFCQQILCCIKCPASYNLYILHPIYLTSYISPMKPRNIFVHWFILSYEGYPSIRPPKKNSLSGRIQAANTRPDVPIHQRLDLIDPVKGNRAPTNSKKKQREYPKFPGKKKSKFLPSITWGITSSNPRFMNENLRKVVQTSNQHIYIRSKYKSTMYQL